MNEDEIQVTPRPQWNRGGGDHDVPYRFGRHATSYLHVRQFAALLVLRARLVDRHLLRLRGGSNSQPEE